MRKKQLHIVNRYFHPVLAGIEVCLLETYSRFDKDEWDITVHTSADTLTEENVLPDEEIIKGMRVQRYHTIYDFFFPRIPWNRADVVLLNNFSLSPILPVLIFAFLLKYTGQKKFKLVLAPHGGFTPIWSSFSTSERLIKKFMHRYLGRFMINHTVDAVQAVAVWEKEQLINSGIDSHQIIVVPNGVEEMAFVLELPARQVVKKLVAQSDRYIMTLSRIHRTKNLDVVIKAVANLPKNVKLFIIGNIEDRSYYHELNKLIQSLNLEKQVIFTGEMKGADKFYMLRYASVMVHVSKYEVDPLAIKESLSQGTICIGAANTGTEYLIKDGINGFLVATDNSDALARKIRFILSNMNGKQISGIRTYNLKSREQYRWSKVSSTLELLFTNLIPRWSWS